MLTASLNISPAGVALIRMQGRACLVFGFLPRDSSSHQQLGRGRQKPGPAFRSEVSEGGNDSFLKEEEFWVEIHAVGVNVCCLSEKVAQDCFFQCVRCLVSLQVGFT